MKKLNLYLNKTFVNRERRKDIKTPADQKQEILIRLGREQFQKLLDKGLNIPIMTI